MKQKIHNAIIIALFFTLPHTISGQSVTFDLKTSPDLEFSFNTIEKYINGITRPNALELNVTATGSEWDLYIGATTTTAGTWNVVSNYSNTGIAQPPVNLVQARIYNTNNTPATGGGFFPVTDIATPVYIIGSNSNDVAVNCGDAVPVGTNQAGSYLTDPECYRFKVDLKIVPGLDYRPGLYTLRIDFILIEDL